MIDIHAKLDNVPIADIRANLLACSVKRSSLDTYHSEVLKLISWARLSRLKESRRVTDPNFVVTVEHFQLYKPRGTKEQDFVILANECTLDDYFSFCSAHAQSRNTQFGRIRAALRLAQMMAKKEVWACVEECKAAEKGAIYMAILCGVQPGPRLRGTLSEQMLADLISWVRARNTFMADAMAIQMGACLRISELIRIAPCHVTETGIFITDQKRDTVASLTSARPRTTLKRLSEWSGGREALKWLQDAAKNNHDYPLLFPSFRFTLKEYNATIREAAMQLNFPIDLLYDGSHILRHTGVGRASRELILTKNITDTAATLLMSVSMVIHYSRSLGDRLKKVRVPAFLTQHLKNPQKIAAREDSDNSESDEELERTPSPIAPLTNRVDTIQVSLDQRSAPQPRQKGRKQPRTPSSSISERPPTGLSNLSAAERNAARERRGELLRTKAAEDAEKRRKKREEEQAARLRRASMEC